MDKGPLFSSHPKQRFIAKQDKMAAPHVEW
jgi:hypothetical protein